MLEGGDITVRILNLSTRCRLVASRPGRSTLGGKAWIEGRLLLRTSLRAVGGRKFSVLAGNRTLIFVSSRSLLTKLSRLLFICSWFILSELSNS